MGSFEVGPSDGSASMERGARTDRARAARAIVHVARRCAHRQKANRGYAVLRSTGIRVGAFAGGRERVRIEGSGKLGKQGSFAGQLYVFAHTSPFRPPPQFSRGVVVPLLRPTADTSILVQAARAGVHRFYERGYQLQKAGVILLDLASSSVHQAELDLGDSGQDDQSHLMTTIDRINSRYGRGTVFVGGNWHGSGA